MKVVVVIPCYNEEQYISELIFLTNKLVGISIVADDGSTDGTIRKAEQSGAYIARNFGKRGVGANTQVGIDEALLRDCDTVITLDGDGQHNPSNIPRLLKSMVVENADVVVGTRFIGESKNVIPLYRRFGIKVITWLYNIGSKQKLSDVQCCFRAFSRNAISKINTTEIGFSFSVEMLIKARKMDLRICEVPVDVLYHRQFSQNSSLNPIIHGLGVAIGVIKWRIKVELLGGGINKEDKAGGKSNQGH